MALNLIQKDINRSIFEAIRSVVVAEGYLPDVVNYTQDAAGTTAFNNDTKAIADGPKGFAIDVFGSSGSSFKGLKKIPRITVHPTRVIPGDIGFDVYQGRYGKDPANPDNWIKYTPPFDTSNLQYDIHLVSETADQDIILTAILYKAIGVRKFLPLYNSASDLFFIRQYDFYDSLDLPEGVNEKISSFQVDDLILVDEERYTAALIQEINWEIILPNCPKDYKYISNMPIPPPGTISADRFVYGERPIGAIDGSNATYHTEFLFIPESVEISLNGQEQTLLVDYNTSGNNTILFFVSPEPGDIITVDYIKEL